MFTAVNLVNFVTRIFTLFFYIFDYNGFNKNMFFSLFLEWKVRKKPTKKSCFLFEIQFYT